MHRLLDSLRPGMPVLFDRGFCSHLSAPTATARRGRRRQWSETPRQPVQAS